jgi:hypothetical protein
MKKKLVKFANAHPKLDRFLSHFKWYRIAVIDYALDVLKCGFLRDIERRVTNEKN